MASAALTALADSTWTSTYRTCVSQEGETRRGMSQLRAERGPRRVAGSAGYVRPNPGSLSTKGGKAPTIGEAVSVCCYEYNTREWERLIQTNLGHVSAMYLRQMWKTCTPRYYLVSLLYSSTIGPFQFPFITPFLEVAHAAKLTVFVGWTHPLVHAVSS